MHTSDRLHVPQVFRALTLCFLLASTTCAQRAESRADGEPTPSRACFAASDGTCVVRGLTVEGSFRLSDSLYAFHRSRRLELDRLLGTPWQLLEEEPVAPPLFLEGVLLAMEETAPELVSDFRTTHSPPTAPEEHEQYLVSLFAAYLADEVDLSDREVPEYEPQEIQIEVIEVPDTSGGGGRP